MNTDILVHRENGNRSFSCGGHVGFFGTSENSQNGIYCITYLAPFRSTIDGFRDNGNRSFGCGGHIGFL